MGNVCSSSDTRDGEDAKAKSTTKPSKAIARGPTFRYDNTVLAFVLISCSLSMRMVIMMLK